MTTEVNSRFSQIIFLMLIVVFFCPFACGKTIYVDDDGAGANDGSSWENAYTFLQDALADARIVEKPVEIRVAQGIYKPNLGRFPIWYPGMEDYSPGVMPGDEGRLAAFGLINGITIIGGYAGIREPDPNERNFELYETILSGDLDDNDVDVNDPNNLLDEPTRAENSYHIVTGSETDYTAVLDGFTITAGNANGTSYTIFGHGGGISNNINGNPTLTNCTFIENSAYYGGGMYNYNNSSPRLTNCTFSRNSTVYFGGGMYNCKSNPTLTNCMFTGNVTRDDGGGIYNNSSYPILSNCMLSGNVAGDDGGGIYNDKSNPTLTNCTFNENLAEYDGGGMSNENCNPTLTNCIFSENEAKYDGGGIYNHHNNPELIDCTFSGNLALRGGGMYNYYYSTPTLTKCTFNGNRAEYGGGGMCNYNSNPILTECIFSCNSANGGGGMYNERNSNPTLTNCTFSENVAEQGRGGGVSNSYSNSTYTDCTFSGNSANSGGGIYNYNSSPTLINCTFVENAALDGGGINNFNNCNPTLTECTFSGNIAEDYGGGLYDNDSNSKLTNCAFIGNSAIKGGGMYINWNNNPILTNCTFAQNYTENGNAFACESFHMVIAPSNVELINCILWDDGNEIWNMDGSTIIIAYSDIRGGQNNVYDPYEKITWGIGNIYADPLFADPGYWADANDPNIVAEPNNPNAIWIEGDYHLKSQAGRWEPNSQSWVQDDVTSPCIDAGDPNSPIGHEPFPNGGIINMGAYGGTAEASKSYIDESL